MRAAAAAAAVLVGEVAVAVPLAAVEVGQDDEEVEAAAEGEVAVSLEEMVRDSRTVMDTWPAQGMARQLGAQREMVVGRRRGAREEGAATDATQHWSSTWPAGDYCQGNSHSQAVCWLTWNGEAGLSLPNTHTGTN